MMEFSEAVVIFNPNSTGDSKTIAKEFAAALRKINPECRIKLQETTHAGHGEELGYKLVKEGQDRLLVSVSGDGGYHELINGVMKAVDEGREAPICAVLPGGNANDHYSNISDRTLLEAIKAGALTKIDLLKIESTQTRYAHSYAGLGLTPLVAVELNKHKLSAFKEMWLAVKTFWNFKPFTIVEGDREVIFDSLIFANIGVMAKHLTLDPDSSPRDGKFEVLRWPHNHKLRLIKMLLQAATGRGSKPQSVSEIKFATINKMPMQLDGELLELEADEKVKVTCVQQVLRTYR